MRNIAGLNGVAIQDQPGLGRRRIVGRVIAWFARHEALLFAAMIVIQLVPIWAFTYLATTDGAAHVASADVMRRIGDPSLSAFRKYYFVSRDFDPNLIGHVVLAGLLYVVKPTVAEKVLVSLYVVVFPLAIRYAMRSVRTRRVVRDRLGGNASHGLGGQEAVRSAMRDRQERLPHRRIRPARAPLAFLAFPLVYSYLYAQGFYNFCLSVAVFFVVVGYWVRYRERMTWGRWLGLAGLAMLLYTCHLFSLALACGVIGVLTVAWSVGEIRAGGGIRVAVRQAAVTAGAFVLPLALAVVFRPSTEGVKHTVEAWRPKEDLVNLLQFSDALVSYRNGEVWLSGAVASVILALVLLAAMRKVRRRDWRPWDALLLVPLGLLLVYFRSQDELARHFYIPHRVMFYLYLGLLLWLAGQPLARRVRWAVVPLAIVLGLGFTASHALKYREFAPQLGEFVSAGNQIKRNATFLPLIFSPRGRTASGNVSSIDVAPFYMASGYIAAERQAVDLRNYEGNTDHFPVRFRPEVNPYKFLAVGDGFNVVPPKIDIERFRRAGGEVDYVIVWGLEESFRSDPDTVALYRQLEAGYERVAVPGARWTEVWKRKGM
ncbi:MAG TPA: hypothetical protein VH475_19875 [Tepidisphaeraceae bacterium]|jgi:hypothetical protein